MPVIGPTGPGSTRCRGATCFHQRFVQYRPVPRSTAEGREGERLAFAAQVRRAAPCVPGRLFGQTARLRRRSTRSYFPQSPTSAAATVAQARHSITHHSSGPVAAGYGTSARQDANQSCRPLATVRPLSRRNVSPPVVPPRIRYSQLNTPHAVVRFMNGRVQPVPTDQGGGGYGNHTMLVRKSIHATSTTSNRLGNGVNSARTPAGG